MYEKVQFALVRIAVILVFRSVKFIQIKNCYTELTPKYKKVHFVHRQPRQVQNMVNLSLENIRSNYYSTFRQGRLSVSRLSRVLNVNLYKRQCIYRLNSTYRFYTVVSFLILEWLCYLEKGALECTLHIMLQITYYCNLIINKSRG